jgi:hypothetical protein
VLQGVWRTVRGRSLDNQRLLRDHWIVPGKYGPNRGRREAIEEITSRLRSHKVEIRFDRFEGAFFAAFGGKEYRNVSINALRETLKEKATTLDEVKWEKWIEYEVDSFARHSWGKKANTSVGLEFSVLELSVSQKGVIRRERRAKIDYKRGTVEFAEDMPAMFDEEGTRADQDPFGSVHESGHRALLIRYTPHRLKLLLEIQGAIFQARAKLHALLAEGQEKTGKGEEAETVAKALDAVTQVLLLPGDQDG